MKKPKTKNGKDIDIELKCYMEQSISVEQLEKIKKSLIKISEVLNNPTINITGFKIEY